MGVLGRATWGDVAGRAAIFFKGRHRVGPIEVPQLTDADMERIAEWLRWDAAQAVKCPRCGCRRCDPPYGDGKECMVCASKPSQETMRKFIGRRL